MSPPISPVFKTLKSRILSSLSVDPSVYTDASPKGSVDSGIRDLIDGINRLDGVVTTSSCAGRVSAFLEGSKDFVGPGGENGDEVAEGGTQTAVPGGKGRRGRWLYVSHDPISIPSNKEKNHFTRLFGLELGDQSAPTSSTSPSTRRFVRFQFEPFILHVATASLHHAKPILSAAINAGFRESGVQSLKNLDDPAAFPMVAIRTAGLALGSVVGVCNDGTTEGEEEIRGLVDDEYLKILVGLANERFVANRDRVARFERELFVKSGPSKFWEDGDARRERKRREGLARRDSLAGKTEFEGGEDVDRGKDQAAIIGGPMIFPSDQGDGT